MQTDSIRLAGGSYREALTELSEYALEQGYIGSKYLDALLTREEEYPTGLEIPTEDFAIAIPHADPDHVREPTVLLGLPDDSVRFHSMEDPSKEVEAELVVLLLITETESYATFLSNLTKLFQDPAFAESVRAKDESVLADLIVEQVIDTDQ